MTTSSYISPAARAHPTLAAIAARVPPTAIMIVLLAGICLAWHVLIGMALGSLR